MMATARGDAAAPLGDGGNLAPVGRTLRVARPAAGKLALSALLGSGTIAASIGLMATAAWLISRAAQHPSEGVLALAIVAVQFFGLARGFCRYGERLVGHDAAFKVLAETRVASYERLEVLAPTGLPAFRSGDLLARLVGDVDSLQDVILRVLPPFAVAAIVGVGTVAVVWVLLPAAGVVLAACLLAAALAVPWLSGRLARRSEAGLATARGDLTASIVDLIEGAPDLIAYGAIDAQLERIADGDARLTAAACRSSATAGVGLGLVTLLTGVAMWGALLVGIVAVRGGQLSGVLLAVVVLIPLSAFELVAGLPGAIQALERSRRSAARVFEVLDASDPVPAPTSPLPPPPPPVAVHAERLRARYPTAPSPALRGVDLDLAAGRRIALVGSSGAGKSALANVLLRFLPYVGSARLDDVELDRIDGDDVRRVVGLVTQDTHLFDATLGDNLRIGRREASDVELQAVLRRVGLGPFVDQLEDGLATEVGDRGTRLSGGQRQRVAVARALLADFPVLVVDEAAEHLDDDAARALTRDLLALTDGRSTLFITHRLAGLEQVDEILLLEAGRVAERGTHAELVATGGRYARRWELERAAEQPSSTEQPTERRDHGQ